MKEQTTNLLSDWHCSDEHRHSLHIMSKAAIKLLMYLINDKRLLLIFRLCDILSPSHLNSIIRMEYVKVMVTMEVDHMMKNIRVATVDYQAMIAMTCDVMATVYPVYRARGLNVPCKADPPFGPLEGGQLAYGLADFRRDPALYGEIRNWAKMSLGF